MVGSERSRSVLLVLATLLVLSVFGPVTPLVERGPTEEKTVSDVGFVRPSEDGHVRLWPYTSRGHSFNQATLPINAVVTTDATTVYQLLTSTPSGAERLYWNKTAQTWEPGSTEQGNVTINGTGVYWSESTGSERYTFVMTNTSGRWTDATYQIHDGTYFGSRYHLRLYEGGDGTEKWTAIQAHHEHWDWFRLRHDVGSLSRAQHHLERDFLGTGVVREMRRERWGNGGAIDADGWVTVIEPRRRVMLGPQYHHDRPSALAPLVFFLPLLGLGAAGTLSGLTADARASLRWIRESRFSRYHAALFASTSLLPLVVRVGAIAAERAFPTAQPQVVGAPFYVLLVVGLPAAALAFGRHLRTTDGFTVAVVGFGVGIMVDYAYLDLSVVSYGALLQRLVLLLGLGLIGAGGSRWAAERTTRYRYWVIGAVIWVGMLVWPLIGR
ncbi:MULTISPECIES: hypothetical protein [Haloarcula]|uniref:hypothetical protein n=1 Tax=Haloarcula TaxID=2237 RepID=UPI00166E7008|nr:MULTISPECIES: hypothetical protein [Halomicroarcula]MBX0349769.1 hypothetical protein [Halomicroarcula pellucida]MDS0279512.1 hypothetical protein [Halomicroarcula sp. S1AR25-4]